MLDRKSTRLNSSHLGISYAVFCLKKKKKTSSRRLPRGAGANAYARRPDAATRSLRALPARAPCATRRGHQPAFELFFFFNDTATTEIYTLSLHDALPI